MTKLLLVSMPKSDGVKCLTDITTSEGKLDRFSKICETIAQAKGLDSNRVSKLIEEKTGLTNLKVIGRHLHILSILGLIQRETGKFNVTSRGKALSRATQKQNSSLERVLFFRSFFGEIPNQLFLVLEVVGRNESKGIEKNTFDYFQLPKDLNPCSKPFEEPAFGNEVPLLPSNYLKQNMLNKFETMVCWLSQLNLVKKGNSALWLTDKGQKLFDMVRTDGLSVLSANVYNYASRVYGSNTQEFDFKEDRGEFVRILREASFYFKGQQNISDLIAAQEYVSAFYATKGFSIGEKKFFGYVQELELDGSIRSVILGRDGKPMFFIMAEG